MNDDQIIARAIEEDLQGDDLERFRLLMTSNPNLRRLFNLQRLVHGYAPGAFEDEIGAERRAQRITETIEQKEAERLVASIQSRIRRARLQKRLIGIAAVLFIVLSVVLFRISSPHNVVATIEAVETVTWSKGSTHSKGDRFRSGDRINIRQGLVKLQMMDRGSMIIEGPAILELVSKMESVLHQGRVLMQVTPKGHGYRIVTSKGTMEDLGTEFGVSVGNDGTVETHVIEGEVKAYDLTGGSQLLRKDDGIRFGIKGDERIIADKRSFYREMPPAQESPPMIHWSFDEQTPDRAAATVAGFGGSSLDMQLLGKAPGELPRRIDGVRKQGVAFDGIGSYGESDFRGIGGPQPRTVCFWVRVPEDFSVKQGFAVVSWGDFNPGRPGEVWQISINPVPYDGPIGRLRLGTNGGSIVGSTDLRDGRWHHAAVVLYGSPRPNVGTHVILYVDGELESISQRSLAEVNTSIENAEHGVWLGRNISFGEDRTVDGEFFRGDLDEVTIFGGALSRDDIRRHAGLDQPKSGEQ
jgi:hypothetical protein